MLAFKKKLESKKLDSEKPSRAQSRVGRSKSWIKALYEDVSQNDAVHRVSPKVELNPGCALYQPLRASQLFETFAPTDLDLPVAAAHSNLANL